MTIFIVLDSEQVHSVSSDYPKAIPSGSEVIGPWEIIDFKHAEELAEKATNFTRKVYIPFDLGSNVMPRYGIMERPMPGDLVSKSFNGDSYPAGSIRKISSQNVVITLENGERAYRCGLKPVWKFEKSPFALVRGRINERNPHF